MAFKSAGPLIEYEHVCDLCGGSFGSFLSPEFFDRKNWVKECNACFIAGGWS